MVSCPSTSRRGSEQAPFCGIYTLTDSIVEALGWRALDAGPDGEHRLETWNPEVEAESCGIEWWLPQLPAAPGNPESGVSHCPHY